MLLIGDNLGMGSPLVETAMKSKDKRVIQELAAKQVEAGVEMLGIDLGPEKSVAMDGMVDGHGAGSGGYPPRFEERRSNSR